MERVVKGIELMQRAAKIREIINSTSRLHEKLQSQSYPKKRRRGLLGRKRKTIDQVKPKNNILDSLIQVMNSYNTKSNIKLEEKGSLWHNVFETHNSIIARVKIPEDISPKNVRMFSGTSSVLVNFGENNNHVIILPHEIKKEEAAVKIKENILEFRAPKLDRSDMHEINIHI